MATDDQVERKQRREQILKKLRELKKDEDGEGSHEIADKLLLELIDDTEIAQAFLALKRWYA